jgi:hypothetical protein
LSALGWGIIVGYESTGRLTNLPTVLLAAGSLTNLEYFYSMDALTWLSLQPALQQGPVQLNSLWLGIPINGTPVVPRIREIQLTRAKNFAHPAPVLCGSVNTPERSRRRAWRNQFGLLRTHAGCCACGCARV